LLPIPSVNSQRLYEILWHDSHAGKKQFLTYEITSLKFQLGLRSPRTVKGKKVWDEKYKPWRDFQKVLRRAQSDFQEYGTLRFTFEGMSRGRSTNQVRFCVTLAQPTELPNMPIETPEDPSLSLRKLQVISALDEAGYRQDPHAAITTYGLDVVEAALKLARDAERKAARSKNPIVNLGGLIHHSLKTGLAKRHLISQTVDRSEAETPNARVLARHLIDAFDDERRQFAERVWQQMTPIQQREFPDIMRLELDNFQLNELEKANWTGPLFTSARNNILIRVFEDSLPEHLGTFEAFVEINETLKKNPNLKKEVLEQATLWHQVDVTSA
jgi:hypothetical protein